MKQILLLITLVAGCLFSSCKKDADTMLNVEKTGDKVSFTAAGGQEKIKVETSEKFWQVVASDGWIVTSRDSCYLVLTADYNPIKKPKSGKVRVIAGDKFVTINVEQQPSERELGEYYYDNSGNPIGVIYKLSNGGKNGMAISLDQMNCFWGVRGVSHTNARDKDNGKLNTRNIIDAHKNDADFASKYPAFNWVYSTKNGGDMDGKWYIPGYNQLMEMYYVLSGVRYTGSPVLRPGNFFIDIAFNTQVRNQFNAWITGAGGTPVTFGYFGPHLSSTEFDADNFWLCPFTTNLVLASKGGQPWDSPYLVRAVLEF